MKPDIFIITTHDSGRHFGCYGVPTVHTPAIDALAASGMQFNNMFATAPICSPSRGSLMTGRYPQSNGLMGLAGGKYGWEFNDPKQHLSHILHNAGYYTAFFGHHHVTHDLSTLGFDQQIPDAFSNGPSPWERSKKPEDRPEDLLGELERYQKPAPGIAADAVEFLGTEAAQRSPFYMQVGFLETHTPYLWKGCRPDDSKGVWVPPYTLSDEQSNDEELHKHIAEFQGSLRRVDEAVEMILNALKKNGLEDNTLVLFTTDHGPELPRAKWTMYDNGTRVAFIMRWPRGGITGGKTCDLLLNNVDFLPALAEIADIPVPDNLEGVSFASVLDSDVETVSAPRDTVYGFNLYGMNYGARTEQYKIIRNFGATHFNAGKFRESKPMPIVELYDLEKDPLEFNNVADDPAYAEVYADMNERLWSWLEEVNDPILLRSPVPSTSYEKSIAEYRQRLRTRKG